MQKYLTWGYLILICAFLPVYMKDGYFMLGEAKGICFMVIAGIYALGLILVNNKNIPSKLRAAEVVDYAALAFLFSNVITFLFSRDKLVSLLGLEGWRSYIVCQWSTCWTRTKRCSIPFRRPNNIGVVSGSSSAKWSKDSSGEMWRSIQPVPATNIVGIEIVFME